MNSNGGALITVLITTYNYGHLIGDAIDSVLSQDFPHDQLEVLIVDDGSTDDTAVRVKKYALRVRYLHKQNGGQASALNFGIEKAGGEIIALLDADDVFLPGKLARIVEAFHQDPKLGMVYHRLLEWHAQTSERREWPFTAVSGDIQKAPDDFLIYVTQPTSCISFRRAALGPLLPIPEDIRMLADCFLVALIPFVAPVLAISEFLALYRIHGENNFSTAQQQVPTEVRKKKLQMWNIVIRAMREWLHRNGYSRKQTPVRVFLDRWTLHQLDEEMLITPPGRLKFFWYLVLENRTYGGKHNYKLKTYNYVAALSSLVFGYNKRHSMYHWREQGRNSLESMFKKFRSALADIKH